MTSSLLEEEWESGNEGNFLRRWGWGGGLKCINVNQLQVPKLIIDSELEACIECILLLTNRLFFLAKHNLSMVVILTIPTG